MSACKDTTGLPWIYPTKFIIVGDDGKFAGTASLVKASPDAVLLGAFSAMSVVTGQYFLTEINGKLEKVNEKLDKIMEFLYGEKRAELLGEISFVQQSHANYNSIMSHNEQRIATIAGLQAAKKVAMKDIEFYLYDLDRCADSRESSIQKFESIADKAHKISESLQLSMQLFTIASIMEIFFSQNFDESYLESVSGFASFYINKCEKRILSDFGKLSSHAKMLKPLPGMKFDSRRLTEPFEAVINTIGTGEESPMLKNLSDTLESAMNVKEYYVNREGEVFIRSAC